MQNLQGGGFFNGTGQSLIKESEQAKRAENILKLHRISFFPFLAVPQGNSALMIIQYMCPAMQEGWNGK